MFHFKTGPFLYTLSLALFLNSLLSACSLTLTPYLESLGKKRSPDFIGLSFEMERLLPVDGHYYFHKDNTKLISLCKQLAIKNIRLGGNTADRPSVQEPSIEDIDAFFEFAALAEVRVIYTLRLRDVQDFEHTVSLAKYISHTYGSLLIGFSLGNEPEFYIKQTSEYGFLLSKFAQALRKEVPEALICGPDTDFRKPAPWVTEFLQAVPVSLAALITQHGYVFGNSFKVADTQAARLKMLSTDLPKRYEEIYQSILSIDNSEHTPLRLTETNSFYNAGAQGVSNVMASALWALDYLHWWAARGIAGINFHTGDQVAAGAKTVPCWYAAFQSTADGHEVKPLGYAIKAFALGSEGRTVPITLAHDSQLNMSAYGFMSDDTILYITVINREPVKSVSIVINYACTSGESIALIAPQNDSAATSGVTLGGASFDYNGSFKPSWQKLVPSQNTAIVEVPPTSAVLVKLF